MVRITLPTGRPIWRYARSGELLLLGDAVELDQNRYAELPFTKESRIWRIRHNWLVPYRYRGEKNLSVEIEGPLMRVNGRVVGIDLFGLSVTRAVILVRKHRSSLQTVLWHGVSRFPPPVVNALSELESRQVTLSLMWYRGTAAATSTLAPLHGRVRALIIGGRSPDGVVTRFRSLGEFYVLSGGISKGEAVALSRRTKLKILFHGPDNKKYSGRRRWFDIKAVGSRSSSQPFTGLKTVALNLYKFSEFDAMSRALPLEQLRELQVTGYPVYEFPKKILRRLVRVERLVHQTVGSPNVDAIARLPRLRSLSLLSLRTPIQDRDLAFLGQAKALRKLDLQDTMVTDDGIARLKGLRQLRLLHISGSLGHHPRRTREHPKVGDVALDHLRQLPNLTVLSIEKRHRVAARYRFSKKGLTALSRVGSLRGLRLVDERLSEGGVVALARMAGLESLELAGRRLSDKTCQILAPLAKLRHLLLRGKSITGVGCESLRQLRSLALFGGVTNSGLEQLAGLISLRSLVLSSPRITDHGIRQLGHLTNLRRLVLSRVSVSDRGLAAIANLPNVRELVLHEAPLITNRAVRHLRKMRSLRHLVLWNTRITRQAALTLKKALPGCRVLVTLR